MVTIGVGESLAIASIVLQLVEVGQSCADWVKRFGTFGEDSTAFQIRFNHEYRKLEALQHVLVDPEKFKLEQPLFELMGPGRQHDLRVVLLYILRLLESFKILASKHGAAERQDKEQSAEQTEASDLSETALAEALPDLIERERFIQTKSTWIKKAIWASTGKKKAERILVEIHGWLKLVQNEIDQFFWTFKIPETTNKGIADRLKSLAADADLVTLSLSNPMRMRQLVLQLEMPPAEIDDPFPDNLNIDATRIQLTIETQPGRYIASLDGCSAITECRSYTAGTFDHVLKGMQNLCALLALDKHEQFRLPKAEGLYHNDDSVHIVILASSVYAEDAGQIWSLSRIMTESKVSKVLNMKPPPLEVRIKLAQDIAVAVAKFHSIGWLHQGIQSRNTAIAVDLNDGPSYGNPFLLGFSKSRALGDSSFVDNDPLNNLYQHPDRWQPSSTVAHTAVYDLYSLGVILLEIGLWKGITDILKTAHANQKFDIKSWKGSTVREFLLKWTPQLGFKAGSTYQQIVEVLLMSKQEDQDNSNWQTSPPDRRILHVVAALSGICASMLIEPGTIESSF